MEENSKVYRIRTKVGESSPNVIHVPINQTYDTFEILSLKLNQTDTYKTYESGYGIIVGRVIANGGFGVPNSKVSVFIEVDDNESLKDTLLYNFTSTSDTDNDGVRYNLLPDYVESECHQDVGTFPNKRLVLDNDDVIEIFDKYWKYTTTTNNSGDYMLFGIPTGSQQLHVDIDLSDCGVLSQRPHNMIGKGYDIGMFESPNKFKSSTNLNSLPQIVTEDRGVYVYPYWGDTSNGDNTFAITRCDINIEYKFEPTAVFMGSIITDKGSNAIGKNCTATINNGKMSELVTGEGTIEMIRKTIDGRVEQFPIMGNRLIDGDGTWVYEIPMNLDYVTTDEFGNFVPTDNPDKGIATRARVRFRVRLDDTQYDNTARKRACYLIPNNPRLEDEGFDKTMEVDYEFGSLTREESYRDLFWNKVYTVKSYIPKIQKGDEQYNRQHTGIKWVNHANQNNPMPYNTLTVKLSFVHRIICILTGLVVQFVAFINQMISLIGFIFATFFDLPSILFNGLGSLLEDTICLPWPLRGVCIGDLLAQIFYGIGKGLSSINLLGNMATDLLSPRCIVLDSGFCDDNVNKVDFYPGCGYFLFNLFPLEKATKVVTQGNIAWEKTKDAHDDEYKGKSGDEVRTASNHTGLLHNCYENALAQENEATSFNFNNDWINGTLYAPLWYRKITPKKRFFFGLFSRKAKDEWCTSKQYFPSLRYIQHCAIERDGSKSITNFDGDTTDLKFVKNTECEDGDCHERHVALPGLGGVIHNKKTMLGQDVYYYKPVEWSANLPSNELYTGKKKGELKLLFATDIVLLGSLDSCDMNGIPQFFKNLESTTYNMPGDILFTDYEFHYIIDPETGNATSNYNTQDYTVHSEMAGCDWGNPNEFNMGDGGLFYGIGCTNGETELYAKSCVNLSRICEYGVSLDVTKQIPIINKNNEKDWENASESEIEQTEDGKYYKRLITDGFISWDELYNLDERSMFATMNGNQLKTKINTKNGLKEYDFRYLYPENFDGSLAERMKRRTQNYPPEVNYKFNYLLEKASRDYYLFRMGNKPYYYDSNNAFPRYENSFYFYFGLNEGKTAIEKFNSKYFAECDNEKGVYNNFNIYKKSSSWCSSLNNTYDGFIALDLEKIATPYSIVITGDDTFTLDDIRDEKIIFYNYKIYSIPEGFEDYSSKKFEEFEDENKNIFIPNGAYYLTITDANEEEYHYEFDMSYNFLMYSNNVQSFKKNHEDLLRSLGTNNAIMNDDTKLVYSNPEKIEREIGGVITVYGVHDNDGDIEQYKIEVREKVDFDITNIQKTIEKEGETWYDKEGVKHTASSKDVGTTVEDYDQMKKELIIPEWYDKNAVKHYLTEKNDGKYVYEEGTQQADFNPLVKELTIVGYTWYDEEDNVYKVTSVADGKIHYTINGKGDYTIDGDTWYDVDGYFCEVTKIDTDGTIHYTKNVKVGDTWLDKDGALCEVTSIDADGTIHYTKNGEGNYTIVDYTISDRNTVVNYTDWTLELNLPTYYNKNGEKQYYSYQPNKETSVVDFELSDRLKEVTSIIPQGEEILTVEQWNSLSTEEKTLYEEVYVNKTDETDIRSKEQWEALESEVERANYVKKYSNRYTIIHYTKNGEGDYRDRDTWYDADGVKHTASNSDIGRTLVDYTDWVLELTPPTWYDLDGNFCKVTSVDTNGTIHYTKNGKGDYTDKKIGDTVTEVTFNSSLENTPYLEYLYNLYKGDEYVEKNNLEGSDGVEYGINYKVISPYALTTDEYDKLTEYGKFDYEQIYVNKQDSSTITIEAYNQLPDGYSQKSYDVYNYINKQDSSIITKEQWEDLSEEQRENYKAYTYVNKYDATNIISSEDWGDLSPDYCKGDYAEAYVSKTDETKVISKEIWQRLSDGYGKNHYKTEISYCKIENKIEHITKEEYDGNIDIQFLYQQFHVLNEKKNNILIENGYAKTLKEEDYTKIIVNYEKLTKELVTEDSSINFITKDDKNEKNLTKGSDGWYYYYTYEGKREQYINETPTVTDDDNELDFAPLVRVLSFETWLDEDGALCEVTSITPQGEKILTVEQWNSLSTEEKTLYDEVYVNKTDSDIIISKEQWEKLESDEEREKYDEMYRNKVIIHYTKNGEGDYTIVGRNTVINYNQPIWTKTTRSDDNYSWVDKNGITQYAGAETLVVDYSWLLETTTQEEIVWYDKEGNAYKVTSIDTDGKIHYTINGKGDNTDKTVGDIVVDFNHDKIVLTLDEIGDAWYDEEGNFCEVTSIDADGTIHYTKNGEGNKTDKKVGDTVVNYYRFMTEPLYLPTWYDADGNLYKVTSIGNDGSTIHYSMNGEGDYTDKKIGDTVVDWSKYIGYEGAEITYDNGVITGITNVLWYDSVKQSFAFGVPDENRTYIITVTQLCNVGDTVFETKNRIETNVFVSGVIKYKMFINGIDYEIIKNFDGHTGWSYNGTITKNKLATNVGDLNENNPWFNVDKIYYHDYFEGKDDNKDEYPKINLKDIERFGIDKNENEQTYAIYATEIDKEDEEVGKKVNETYHGEDGKNKKVKAEDIEATFVKQRNEDDVTTYKVIDFTVKKLTADGDTWYDADGYFCEVTSIDTDGTIHYTKNGEGNYTIVGRNTVVDYSDWVSKLKITNKQTDFIQYVNKQDSSKVIDVEAYNQLLDGYSQKSYDVYQYVNKTDSDNIISKEGWETLGPDERANYKSYTYVNKYDATIITSDDWDELSPDYCKGDYESIEKYFEQYKNNDNEELFISPEQWKTLDPVEQGKYTKVYLSTWYDKNGTLNYMLPSEEGQKRIDFRPLVKEIEKEDDTWYDVNSVKRVAGSDDIGQEVLDYSKQTEITKLKEIKFETSDKTWYDKNGIVNKADSDKLGLYIDMTYMTKGDDTTLFNIKETGYIDTLFIDKLKVDYNDGVYTYQYNFDRNGLHSVRIYLVQKTTYGDLLNDVIDFNECSDLNTIVLPNIGITTIGDSAFKDCKSLTSIDLPDSITTIDDDAFNGCEKLSSVYIPYNVKRIGNSAFNGCKSFTNIVLPENITTIGDYAFAKCENLQNVRAEMKDVTNTTVGANAFVNTNIGLIIYVPMDKDGKIYDDSTTSYNKAGWGDDVQDKVVAIELTVFNYNKVNINPSDLLDEFARNTSGNTNGNTVYYNFTDSYVAGEYKAFTQVTYFKASDFVNTINNVLSRRREIADRMFNAFYMTQEGETKSFKITSNTDETPVQPIIVYHEEEVDDENEYILSNTNLTYEQTDTLKNINIPTITYKSSPLFGDGTSSDEIMIAKSNNIEKKPLSTGIMNVKQKSIPLDSGNKDFPSISLSGGVKAINPSKTNIVDLFEFPVIDKIESSSVSGWTKFSNIPSPNPNNIGMINMDGYVYGRHNNGVVERDGKFETRKLGKYEINLSENLNGNVENSTKPYTYTERRVITGLTNYSIAQWCIVKLKNIVQADDVTEETLNNIWNMLFNPTNEENKPTYDKEKLLEVIDTMTVLKQTIDENLVIYIQCDETIVKDKHQWKIDQGEEDYITNSLIQFKNFNVVVSNDNDKKRQYAFTDAKRANLNIGEINENFNFDNELKLSTEIESIDVSGQSEWATENLTRLSFNQGEKEGGHYQLFALSRYRDGFYGEEDMKQYPLYKAYKATNNGIVYQIDNVEEETLLSHEGEITEINNKEKKIQGTFDEPYHSPYFYSMYKFKGSNDDERVRRNSESTNGLYKAQRDFNVIFESRWVYNWRTGRSESYSRNVPNEYFLNTDLIRHVYCVYVKGNMKMLSPLYEFAPTQLVGTCGNLESYDGREKSVIGVKVNDYARVYFKNYDYILGGPFKIKRKYGSLDTHTIPEGTIKYKDEEYYYMIVDKLVDEIYEFEYNMGRDKMYDNFHEDHVIAKDITDLRHLTWTNGNQLKRDEFILINWVVPESDSFRFISEQKDIETEDFVELATVEKVYRKGEILTRLPKNNGQHYDDGWVIHYMDGTDDVVKNTTDDLLNGNIIIDKPCIITKQNKNE